MQTIREGGGEAVLFDVRGLRRMMGSPAGIAREVASLLTAAGLRPRLAVAATMTSAWLLAHARPGVTVVDAGEAAEALSALPLGWLTRMPATLGHASPEDRPGRTGRRPVRNGRHRRASARHYRMAPGPEGAPAGDVTAPVRSARHLDRLTTLERWGLRTLGDLARLPRADVHARLGPAGVRWHQAACGEDAAPLVPSDPEPRWIERLELDWPVEGLEPLAFVLGRLCDALAVSLERADRGAVAVTTRLQLVSRTSHVRTLRLPAPMRDGRVLRTLILLDLESHPPEAGIDVVEVEAEVAPGSILQRSLLGAARPSFEDLATLIARLKALMGDARVGAPALVDTYDERAVAMAPFTPDPDPGPPNPGPPEPGIHPPVVLRRFRLPVSARVLVEGGRPVRVVPAVRRLPGGRVIAVAGPWRSSGRWWAQVDAPADARAWDRDEWDVELDGGGPIYRLSRDRLSGHWQIEGLED